MSVYAMGLTNG